MTDHPAALPPEPFSLEVEFPASDLHVEWQRCNLIANYVAEYIAHEFQEREWAENLISTVTNECLEAVTILSPQRTTFSLRCTLNGQDLEVEFVHRVEPALSASYLDLLDKLRQNELEALYLELLSTFGRPAPPFNQLGLVMIAHDFYGQIFYQSLDDHQVRLVVRLPMQTILDRARANGKEAA